MVPNRKIALNPTQIITKYMYLPVITMITNFRRYLIQLITICGCELNTPHRKLNLFTKPNHVRGFDCGQLASRQFKNNDKFISMFHEEFN